MVVWFIRKTYWSDSLFGVRSKLRLTQMLHFFNTSLNYFSQTRYIYSRCYHNYFDGLFLSHSQWQICDANNSRMQLNYVCLQFWYTRKYNVKILIWCALKICTCAHHNFSCINHTPIVFSAMKFYVWLITGFIFHIYMILFW